MIILFSTEMRKRKRQPNVIDKTNRNIKILSSGINRLPDVCWIEILSFCLSQELYSVLPVVCERIRDICEEHDEVLWRLRCETLWRDKIRESWLSFSLTDDLKYRYKYFLSLQDSKRTDLTTQELCRFCWGFRFKKSAGNEWTELDPYWSSLTRQEGGSFCIMKRKFNLDGSMTNPSVLPDLMDEFSAVVGLRLRWKFTKSRKSSRNGTVRRGKFLQVNRWPSSGIERTEDWGWLMHNQWVAYAYPSSIMLRHHEYLENEADQWY